MKHILVVQGGGRPNGNTAWLVASFVKGAQESGHTVEVLSLLKNEVKGCLGCNACRYGKPCIQKDAFNDIVPKLKEADCGSMTSKIARSGFSVLIAAIPLFILAAVARR